MSFKLKNFSLQNFNNDVNVSIDPDEKFKRWADYRKRIADFIMPFIKDGNTKNMIVFGAGALNDIELPSFADAFNSIVLTDVDEKSMHEGVKRHGLTSKKIRTLTMDYSGVEEAGLFRSLEQLAARNAPADEIAEYISDSLQSVRLGTDVLKNLEAFDLVMSCPVYTQIVFTQIEAFLRILYDYGMYEYDELNIILNSAYKSMPAIIENYNDLMISCAKNDGLIVLVSDMIEMRKKEGKFSEVKQKILERSYDNKVVEDVIISNGSELAIYGRENLLKRVNIIKSTYLIWPFDENKDYLCSIDICGTDVTDIKKE